MSNGIIINRDDLYDPSVLRDMIEKRTVEQIGANFVREGIRDEISKVLKNSLSFQTFKMTVIRNIEETVTRDTPHALRFRAIIAARWKLLEEE